MTIAILEYETGKGKPRRLKVRPGQSVLIGSSNSSDLRLPDRDQVAAQHCEVTFASGTLAIKNLTNGKQAVRVNGVPVNRQRLNNGDRVEIGNNRLTVVLQNQPDRPSDQAPSVVATAAGSAGVTAGAGAAAGLTEEAKPVGSVSTQPDKPSPPANPASSSAQPEGDRSPRLERVANGLRIAYVDSFDGRILPLLNPATAVDQCGLLVNHKVSKLTQPPPESEDLLAQQDPEIVHCNDLYWLQFEELPPLMKTHQQYAQQQAATILFSRTPGGVSEGDIKLVANWFLTPGGIKFHLVNGTELLLEKIFSIVDGVIVLDDETGQTLMMFLDSTVTDWKSLEQWIKEVPQ